MAKGLLYFRTFLLTATTHLLCLMIKPTVQAEATNSHSPPSFIINQTLFLLNEMGIKPTRINIIFSPDAKPLLYFLKATSEISVGAAAISLDDFCNQVNTTTMIDKQTHFAIELNAVLISNEREAQEDPSFLRCLNQAALNTEYNRRMLILMYRQNNGANTMDTALLGSVMDGTTINSGVFLSTANISNPDRTSLSEIYKANTEIITRPLAQFLEDESTPRILSEKYVWLRRNNLHGILFKAITETWSPFVTTIHHLNETKENKFKQMEDVGISGFYADIMYTLSHRLNFNLTIMRSNSSSWNLMVKVVHQNEVDLALTGFSHTFERFLLDAWMGIFASIALFIVLFFTIIAGYVMITRYNTKTAMKKSYNNQKMQHHSFRNKSEGDSEENLEHLVQRGETGDKEFEKISFMTSCVFVLHSYIGKRFPSEPKSFSIRIAFASISIGGFIVISLYRAMLGASLAVKIHHPPFSSIEELIEEYSHPVFIENGTSIYRYFSGAEKDSTLYQLFEKHIKYSKYASITEREGFRAIAEGTYPRAILIAVYQPLSTDPNYPCSVTSLPADYRPRGNGLIYQKNWPYTDLLNYHLLKMQEEGIINQLRNRWIKTRDLSTCNIDRGRKVEANLDNVITLFMLYSTGASLCFVIFLFELIKFKFMQ